MLKKLAGTIIFVIVLHSLVAVLESGGSDSSTAVTKITATVLPSVYVSAPADIHTWELKPSEPGIYTKKGVLKVAANTGWKITVKDTDAVTSGHLTEWTGTDYTGRKLQAPLYVSASQDVSLPEGGTIETGTNIGEQEVEVTLKQEVSRDDLHLADGHVYLIVLDFEGSTSE
ncbi:Uncharacterised protein [uncultured archaeon]|nr:Uncharacterised protein [uncultured archaeon]